MITVQDRIRGGLLGLLIGDALGVPYEFHHALDLPPRELIDFEPPPEFDRAHGRILPGTWSDDGAQALCLLASLLDRGRLDMGDFAGRLLDWFHSGYMAVDGIVFDAGTTTIYAMHAISDGVPPESAGPSDEGSNGNGSLMRVLPLALWHHGTDAELVADAHRQSRVTHGHMRAQVCCALYCLLARAILQEHPEPWTHAVQTLRALYADNPATLEELRTHIRPDADRHATGKGYVVESLRAVKEALPVPDYREAVRWAVSLGHDTDTTACIVGGIIGLREGIGGIPREWVAALRGGELYEPLLERLVAYSRERGI